MNPDPGAGPAWREPVASQFAASLEMLGNAIRACPAPVWDDPGVPVPHQFWYLAYHTLFWLDHYLAERERDFTPPSPFTLGELDPAGVYPERAYTPQELLAYLAHGRDKCRAVLGSLDDAGAARRCGFERHDMSVLELHLYNLRHVQHHTGQLQLLLRQGAGGAPGWVGRGAL